MGLDLVRMPPEISRGFTRVLSWATSIVKLADGAGEERVRTREMPEIKWQASKGIFTAARLDEFVGFIRARAGAFHAFRFVDVADFSTNPNSPTSAPTMLDQALGYGDGVRTVFPLRRVYRSTAGDYPQRLAVEDRFIPIVGEVDNRLAAVLGVPTGTTFAPVVAANGTLVSSASYSINLRSREIVFDTAPTAGHLVTWGGYYDWPVRLGEDADQNLEEIREAWKAGNVPNIPLVCVPSDRFGPETDDPGGCQAITWVGGIPVINKGAGKVVELTPQTSGLSCALQDLRFLNYGGPHFILLNRGTDSVVVKNELTGATIVTLAAAGNTTAGAYIFVRGTGSSRAYFAVSFPA